MRTLRIFGALDCNLSVQLTRNVQDSIVGNLPKNGEYSATSVYKARFDTTPSSMQQLIWRTWAPPKRKAYQNRLWMTDRLVTRGWPKQKVCVLCHAHDESLHHMLSHSAGTTSVFFYNSLCLHGTSRQEATGLRSHPSATGG
jgi:hypothetical protein